MRPYDYPDDYETIVLGTARSPGVCVVSGHDRSKDYDVQKPKGSTGASAKKDGDPVGDFTVTFYLADDQAFPDDSEELTDFERWDNFQKLLETMDRTNAALPIYHPDLARQGFTEVEVSFIGGRVHDGKGGASHVVKFIEHKPPKPKPVQVAEAKPDTPAGPAAKPDPNARAKAELEQLLAEARKP